MIGTTLESASMLTDVPLSFAKVLGNRSKTGAVDAKMLYTLHVLLTEEDFRIPEIDEIAEQLEKEMEAYAEDHEKTREV